MFLLTIKLGSLILFSAINDLFTLPYPITADFTDINFLEHILALNYVRGSRHS